MKKASSTDQQSSVDCSESAVHTWQRTDVVSNVIVAVLQQIVAAVIARCIKKHSLPVANYECHAKFLLKVQNLR